MLASLAADVVDGEKLAGTDLVDFVTDVPPSFTIRGDREQLYRVISNLVRNARQAIEATGQPGTIEIGGVEEDGGWWIRIGDTGPGLPQKTREHLFEPFHAGNRKGGTGLGLAIAAELIRGHGGRLDLVRSDEHGTEFMAHIPRELGELEQAAQ
jgi:signal transduction histidine kinase